MFGSMSASKNCCNIVYLMETNLSKHRNNVEVSIFLIGLKDLFKEEYYIRSWGHWQ